jgi:hypothetical protein
LEEDEASKGVLPAEVDAQAEEEEVMTTRLRSLDEATDLTSAGPSKRARMTGVFEAERRAAVTTLTRELTSDRINLEKEESSRANTTSWMNRDDDVLEMELLEEASPTPPGTDEPENVFLQWAREKERSFEEPGNEKKSDSRTLKQKLEAAKKLEEKELVRLAKQKEVIERREREEAMERFQLEEDKERRSSQNLSQWIISSECTGHGCQPISIFEVVGGWA